MPSTRHAGSGATAPATKNTQSGFPGMARSCQKCMTELDAEMLAEFDPKGYVGSPTNVSDALAVPLLNRDGGLQSITSGAALATATLAVWGPQTGATGSTLCGLPEAATVARILARVIVQRGWVTPYQINQLLQGRGRELVLGPYLILERLGEGGAGQAFKARHQKMNRVVALKAIRSESLADAEVVGRFYREIHGRQPARSSERGSRLRCGARGAAYFLAMEYVEGTDLRPAGRSRAVRCRWPRPASTFARRPSACNMPTSGDWCIATSSRTTQS